MNSSESTTTKHGSNARFAALTAAALVAFAGQAVAQATATGKAPTPPASETGPAPVKPGAIGGQPLVSKPDAGGTVGGLRNPLQKDPANAASPAGGNVQVDENLIVDLHVNDEDLANVLQMLSIQSQRNIVASKSVSASVTANLYGVTFYQALDAILHVNGYGYIERDNFIYVYTLAEIQEIEKTLRKRVSKVMSLNYLNSTDAAEFAKGLLSENGSIKVNGKVEEFNIGTNPVGEESFANSSTMVIFDYEENVGEIEQLLVQLDTKPQQVLVEATILQSTLTESNAFGVDFAAIADLNFLDFTKLGGPLKAVDGLISGGGNSGSTGTGGSGGSGTTQTAIPSDDKGFAIGSTPGNTAGPGTLKLGIVASDVAAFVRLLDEVTDTTVISRPTILTLNRQPASVLVGRNVGYINTVSTDTSSNTSLATISTGTQLFLRPFVSKDGTIRMELKPKVSEPVFRTVTGPSGQAISIPDEITNELTANVNARDGQTIVLGGLFREGVTANRRQVPGAGDLPIIGNLFRGNDDSTNRSEIIFLITPSLVSDETLIAQGERAEGLVENTRTGIRKGLLPWSREKQSQKLNIEAERLAAAGDVDGALNKLQRSLSLYPQQPEAIALREKLMNEKEHWPSRSMMTEIVTNESMIRAKRAEGYVERHPKYLRNARKNNPSKTPEPVKEANATPPTNTPWESMKVESSMTDADSSPDSFSQPSEPVFDSTFEPTFEPSVEPSTMESPEYNHFWNNDSFNSDPQASSSDDFFSNQNSSNSSNNTFNAAWSNSNIWGATMAASASANTGFGPCFSPVGFVTETYWNLFTTSGGAANNGGQLTNVESDPR